MNHLILVYIVQYIPECLFLQGVLNHTIRSIFVKKCCDNNELPHSKVNFLLPSQLLDKLKLWIERRFLASLRPSIGCYRHWIELELNLASVGDSQGVANARKLYESALSTFKHDIQLWHDYYSMEVKVGTSETANAVHWRARKTLGEKAGLMVSRNP